MAHTAARRVILQEPRNGAKQSQWLLRRSWQLLDSANRNHIRPNTQSDQAPAQFICNCLV